MTEKIASVQRGWQGKNGLGKISTEIGALMSTEPNQGWSLLFELPAI